MAGLNQMPSDLERENMKMCWAKGQTNPWATKPLLTASTMINSCLASPLHRVCTEKHYWIGTHSHIYCHIQTALNKSKNENSPDTKYQTVLSTGSKKSSVWPPLSRVHSALTPHQRSNPGTFWARQCWKEVKTWKGYLFNPVCDTKLTTDPKSWLVNK